MSINEDELSNTGLTKETLMREAGVFGRASGRGANSRPAMALRYLEAANKLPNVGPDDAKEVYTNFSKAEAQSRGIEHKTAGSAGVQISKLKRFGELGQLPRVDGVEVMSRAVEIIQRLTRQDESPIKGSTYDAMVKVARVQLLTPNVALTDDQITDAVTPDPVEKSDTDKLVEAYKKVFKTKEDLAKAGHDTDYVDLALENLAEQIKAMDGELPPMTKDEKERAKLEAMAARQGMTITPKGNLAPIDTTNNVVDMIAAFEQE